MGAAPSAMGSTAGGPVSSLYVSLRADRDLAGALLVLMATPTNRASGLTRPARVKHSAVNRDPGPADHDAGLAGDAGAAILDRLLPEPACDDALIAARALFILRLALRESGCRRRQRKPGGGCEQSGLCCLRHAQPLPSRETAFIRIFWLPYLKTKAVLYAREPRFQRRRRGVSFRVLH